MPQIKARYEGVELARPEMGMCMGFPSLINFLKDLINLCYININKKGSEFVEISFPLRLGCTLLVEGRERHPHWVSVEREDLEPGHVHCVARQYLENDRNRVVRKSKQRRKRVGVAS